MGLKWLTHVLFFIGMVLISGHGPQRCSLASITNTIIYVSKLRLEGVFHHIVQTDKKR